MRRLLCQRSGLDSECRNSFRHGAPIGPEVQSLQSNDEICQLAVSTTCDPWHPDRWSQSHSSSSPSSSTVSSSGSVSSARTSTTGESAATRRLAPQSEQLSRSSRSTSNSSTSTSASHSAHTATLLNLHARRPRAHTLPASGSATSRDAIGSFGNCRPVTRSMPAPKLRGHDYSENGGEPATNQENRPFD